MRRPSRRSLRIAAAALAALAAVVAGSACGTEGLPSENASTSQGKQLFTSAEAQCGACHTLADAGTRGTAGPNLDDAFAGPRADGFEESSIAAMVLDQIHYPTKGSGMPANLVTGEEAAAVANYVASVAGDPEKMKAAAAAKTTAKDGKTIFAESGCATCHTLAAANARGTVGPNLDASKPSLELAVDRVTHGKGVMPAFGGQLSDEQIEAVAKFVSSSAGKK